MYETIIIEEEAINMRREAWVQGRVAGRGWKEKRETESDVILFQFKASEKKKSTNKFQRNK